MGGDGNGCGIGLLGVTSNKLVTFPRQNSIRPWAHAAPSGECNCYMRVRVRMRVRVCVCVCVCLKCMYMYMYTICMLINPWFCLF